jgi:hypothetical protein
MRGCEFFHFSLLDVMDPSTPNNQLPSRGEKKIMASQVKECPP